MVEEKCQKLQYSSASIMWRNATRPFRLPSFRLWSYVSSRTGVKMCQSVGFQNVHQLYIKLQATKLLSKSVGTFLALRFHICQTRNFDRKLGGHYLPRMV